MSNEIAAPLTGVRRAIVDRHAKLRLDAAARPRMNVHAAPGPAVRGAAIGAHHDQAARGSKPRSTWFKLDEAAQQQPAPASRTTTSAIASTPARPATSRPPPGHRSRLLLQRLERIDARGSPGRQHAEQHARRQRQRNARTATRAQIQVTGRARQHQHAVRRQAEDHVAAIRWRATPQRRRRRSPAPRFRPPHRAASRERPAPSAAISAQLAAAARGAHQHQVADVHARHQQQHGDRTEQHIQRLGAAAPVTHLDRARRSRGLALRHARPIPGATR